MARLHVLVPLDGSSFSREILPALRRLLQPENYAITLLRVTAEPAGVTTPPRPLVVNHMILLTYDTAEDATRARHPIYATQVAANVEAAMENELQPDVYYLQAAGFEVKTAVSFGDPADAIANYAEINTPDLVAMATHGRAGVSRLVLGSIAEQVLRRVDVPVMMVRPTADRFNEDHARRN